MGMHAGFWCESHRKRKHYEDLKVGWSTILKWIFRNNMELYGLDISASG
jgi:hypothetical protein